MKIVANTDLKYAAVIDSSNTPVAITSLNDFAEVLSSNNTSFDTGFMPQSGTGILRIRKSGEFTQICYQQSPTVSLVKWGYSEGDPNAKIYNLAHPFKIWIVDYHKDLLVGLRHFFSPQPIEVETDPLYHTTYPNTNCNGYGNTSVGWVCLYQTGSTALTTIHEKLFYAWERESGLHEPYNDANMSSTDGPRFYNKRNKPLYNDKNAWEKKSLEEGFEWMLDPQMLIPIKIAKTDQAATTHSDTGETYTFADASTQPYYPYYFDRLDKTKKDFYMKGWGEAGSSQVFDSKVLSKLSLKDNPNIDKQTVLSDLSLKPVSKVDFSSFTTEASEKLSSLIIKSKKKCSLCGTLGQHELTLVPVFSISDKENFLLSPETLNSNTDIDTLYIGIEKFGSYEYFQDKEFCCSKCLNDTLAIKKPTVVFKDNGLKIENAAFLTKSGVKKFSDLHKDSGYAIDNENVIPDVATHFEFIDSGKYVPNISTVECISCNTLYEYDSTHGGAAVGSLFNNKYYGLIDKKQNKSNYLKRQALFCTSPQCKNNEKLLSKLIIKDTDVPLGEILPISDYKSCFETSLWETNSLVRNDITVEHYHGENPNSFFDVETLHLSKNLYLQPNEEGYISIVDKQDLSRDIGLDDIINVLDFNNFYASSQAYILCVLDNGIKTFFIDTKANLESLTICACEMVVSEETSMQTCEGMNKAVCTSCINPQGNYQPLIITAKDS